MVGGLVCRLLIWYHCCLRKTHWNSSNIYLKPKRMKLTDILTLMQYPYIGCLHSSSFSDDWAHLWIPFPKILLQETCSWSRASVFLILRCNRYCQPWDLPLGSSWVKFQLFSFYRSELKSSQSLVGENWSNMIFLVTLDCDLNFPVVFESYKV